MKTADHMTVLTLPVGELLQAQVQVRVDLELLARMFVVAAHRTKGKKRSFAGGAVQIEIVAYPSRPNA